MQNIHKTYAKYRENIYKVNTKYTRRKNVNSGARGRALGPPPRSMAAASRSSCLVSFGAGADEAGANQRQNDVDGATLSRSGATGASLY